MITINEAKVPFNGNEISVILSLQDNNAVAVHINYCKGQTVFPLAHGVILRDKIMHALVIKLLKKVMGGTEFKINDATCEKKTPRRKSSEKA